MEELGGNASHAKNAQNKTFLSLIQKTSWAIILIDFVLFYLETGDSLDFSMALDIYVPLQIIII